MIGIVNKSVYKDDYKLVVERLKRARLDAGLSQQTVADKLGRPQSYISKIESGERRVDIIEVKALAKLYNQKIEELVS